MAEQDECKRSLAITIPAEEVDQEMDRIVQDMREKVRLPGFRPGKVPASMIRSRFAHEIRKEVLETLIPKYLKTEVERANLELVGTPNVKDVKLEKGQPLEFTAEFEVQPDFELEEYLGIEVPYEVADVTDDDLDQRLEQIREQKVEFVNLDPRPAEDGDYAAVSLRSVGGVDEPIENDHMVVCIGADDTIGDFSENLRGMAPGDEKEFDVTYPDDYVQQRLAGKSIRFHTLLKAVQKKELPELDDEFAKDLGDYKDLGELRDAVRSTMKAEREFAAQQEAKGALVEKLVDKHDFPVPEAYIDGQIEANVRQRLGELAAQGVDPRNIKLDWEKVKESQRGQALRDVRASLILDKIAERETVEVTREEVDQQVQRIAQQRREPAAAVRRSIEEGGEIGRIVARIRTEKTLNVLFEQSRKTAKPVLEEKEDASEDTSENTEAGEE